MNEVTNTQVAKMNIVELTAAVLALTARIDALEAQRPAARSETKVEMTDDHARRILTGDLKDAKHKDAAEATGLSYGQIYSCRLGHTFRAIHEEMKAAGVKNTWLK